MLSIDAVADVVVLLTGAIDDVFVATGCRSGVAALSAPARFPDGCSGGSSLAPPVSAGSTP